jgi:IS5 family transposase
MSHIVSFNTFADLAVEKRKIKAEFFAQLDKIIDWTKVSREIKKYYNKGLSADGRPSYDGILLFKITLLQTWYGLSDYEVEDSINDRISFSRFVGLSLEDTCPDHSVISRFRKEMTKKNGYDKILKFINEQLEKHNIIVKQGVLVDASITDSPRKPRGKKEFEVIESENQDTKLNEIKLIEKQQSHVDKEAKWIIKNKKLRFGYKKHFVTDDNGTVIGVHTTAANVNEISNLEEVLDKCDIAKGTKVKADKGYKSQKNDELLAKKGLRNHIMYKAKKNKPLTNNELKFNKLIGKIRYKIERTFGSIARWFQTGKARYVGLAKTHSQHVLEAIAYNLYRSPGLIMSKI